MRTQIAMLSALALCLTTIGCSKTYPLEATFIDGKLAFVSDHHSPEQSPYCLAWVTVAEEGGRIVWSFDAYEAYKDAEHCDNFPLLYGKAPPRAKVEVAPQSLVPGRRYFVSVDAGSSYEGAFRYSVKTVRSVENLDTKDPEIASARNHALHYDDNSMVENVAN